MRALSTVSVIVVFALCCLMVGVFSGCRQRQDAAPSSTGDPKILSHQVLFVNLDSKMKILMLKFQTDDISKVEKNRRLAERLLPEAEKEADAEKATTICIQAVQLKSAGFLNLSKNYGYVWNKGIDGHWQFYEGKAKSHE